MQKYRGVSLANVNIDMGFWQNRQSLNRNVTIYAVQNRFADTGRFDALACQWREGQPNRPHIFWDSDTAKWIESVAYLIQKAPMPDLEKAVEAMIDQIEAHQSPEGYFNSYFISVDPGHRWTKRDWHELYCAGHLMEAAIAWKAATGRDRFLRIMCLFADHIDQVFRIEGSASFTTSGHEEIELALVKLYHATNEVRYLHLAEWFIDQRSRNDRDFISEDRSPTYHQDHLPCAEQTTAVGHAVRACYLYTAMADIARERNDAALKSACEKLFENITQRRMYITGGIGSTHCGEAFTLDYDLPNQTAYTETCASIALAYFAQRMLLMDADHRYSDIIERVIYNGFLSSTSLDGKRFFYTNPMEIEANRRHYASGFATAYDWLPSASRVEVFSCSCCPPNITRFVASMGDMIYTEDDDHLYIHQYMGNHARIGAWQVEISTDYPVSGIIKVRVKGMQGKKLGLRIPQWCQAFTLNASYTMEKGYALIDIGDEDFSICLNLTMSPVLIEGNPNIADTACKAAIMRGPIVYCMEGADNGDRLFDCMIDAEPEISEAMDVSYNLPVLRVQGYQRAVPEDDWFYRPLKRSLISKTLTFIPYYAMANRSESDMRIWIPLHY